MIPAGRILNGLLMFWGVALTSAQNPAMALTKDSSVENGLRRVLNEHCIDCHSDEVREGNVRLDNFVSLDSARKESLLNRVEEQVFVGRMPPRDAGGLSVGEQREMLSLIQSTFGKLGTVSLFREKAKSPGYGNYIDHDRLFNGEIKAKAFSPPRLWRTSPYVFENVKSKLGADPQHLRQPFIVDDKQGIRDYASLLFADSAVVDVLLSNAGRSADRMMQREAVYRNIVDAEQAINESQLMEAISRHFQRVVYREPTAEELARYRELFRKSENEAGRAEALRVTLMAVMLHHEAVYRVEIGLGPKDQDGRRILSPTELAFAIAYALTDRPPDKTLLDAAKSGQL